MYVYDRFKTTVVVAILGKTDSKFIVFDWANWTQSPYKFSARAKECMTLASEMQMCSNTKCNVC